MAGNSLRKARCYTQLPVWVVEDHNDVLPHIYRAIASRHLPFQGMTMLHFDSHPDLQIATEMDADTVFDKFELFSSLSIENWILPAVYAGHFNHVVWIKPPWADQLPEGSRQVLVGRHSTSKKLRISWPDGYFLSDLLYASEEDLECPRELTVDVVTMETDSVASGLSKSKSDDWSTAPRASFPSAGQTPDHEDQTLPGQRPGCHQAVAETVPPPHTVTDGPKSRNEGQSREHHRAAEKRTAASLNIDGAPCRTEGMPSKAPEGSHSEEPCRVLYVTSAAIQNSTGMVLDIDLDFFSTRNPFKEIYPESLFRLLEDLYSFEGPVDGSASALADCMRKRGTQLKELETALRLAVGGEETSDEVAYERFCKVRSLVEALRGLHGEGKGERPDAEMIHMAGLTCDDTGELPHHVSTEEEIDSLVAAMETHLSRLPKPVMVTVARSSHDDYCPPEQVDLIQQKVLKMLQNVYGKLDVHLDYENQTGGSEKT